jgi:phytoene desaturase
VKHAVIAGGGLGGLAVALRLQSAGWQATVCEAGPTFGGKMNRWSKDCFHFDTGPSLITMPWVFRETFAAAGGSLEDHVELQPLDPIAEYRFDDGTRFEYTSVLPDWLATLKRIAPRDQVGFFQFLALGSKLFEVSKATFFKRSPFEAPAAGEWRALRNIPLRRGWGSYQRTMESFFRSPHLRQLYGRYPTYVGSSPWRSPATLAVIPYIEFAFGGYAVRGGLYRIVEGLVALAKDRGVQLLANARVNHIITEGGTACGVELGSGEKIRADVVVMNGDYAATAELLGKAAAPLKNRSMSGFVQLYGLRKPLAGIHQHTVCFSADYRREFTQIFDEQRFPDDPTVYVNAPDKGDTLFIMANAPATEQQWDAGMIAQAQARVLARLHAAGFPDFGEDVVVSDVWTPSRIASRYLMPGGAIYGSASHGWRDSFLRPRNANPKVRGLFHVGGSTHPGGGTPTVLMSADITARLIRQLHP